MFVIIKVNVLIESLLNCVPYVLASQRDLCAYVPCVLTCSHANVPCVLTCPRANVPCVLTCWRANVLCMLTWLRANMPCLFTCSRANMLMCSRALRAYVPTCLTCLSAQMPTCLCAYVLTCERASSFLSHVPVFLAWLVSSFNATFFQFLCHYYWNFTHWW